MAEYSPLEVKKSVVGYGRAEKAQVQQMVASLLRLAAPPRPKMPAMRSPLQFAMRLTALCQLRR